MDDRGGRQDKLPPEHYRPLLAEAERRASFVVLTADPLADIRNTRRIESVYLNGREVDRDTIARALRGVREPGDAAPMPALNP